MELLAVKCPICHTQMCVIKVARTGKSLYFQCVDCGLQCFVRFKSGQRRLLDQAVPYQMDERAIAPEGEEVTTYAQVLESRG